MMKVVLWLPLSLLLALAGCATTESGREAPASLPSSRPEASPSRVQPSAQPPKAGDKVTQVTTNAAVVALWRESESARQANQLDRAADALERALRIAPRDAVLWSRLAELRLRQNQHVQAENLAAKSNALAAGNQALQYRNWLLIGRARQNRGDLAGAEQAARQAQLLKQ